MIHATQIRAHSPASAVNARIIRYQRAICGRERNDVRRVTVHAQGPSKEENVDDLTQKYGLEAGLFKTMTNKDYNKEEKVRVSGFVDFVPRSLRPPSATPI